MFSFSRGSIALVIGILLVALGHLAKAGVSITAGSVSFADVSAAVNLASDGDAVTIPAGTATWVSTLVVKKNISIIGAGIGQTIITDQVPKGTGLPSVFSCSLHSGTELLRVSGFTINGSSSGSTGSTIETGSLGVISISGVSSTPNVRIDHVKIYQAYARPIVFFGGVWGVVDHCDFTMGPWTGGIDIQHDTWKGVGNYGDNSWADAPNWGSNQAIFFEDDTFTGFSGATFIDGDSGMRAVVRHCNIFGSEGGNHGTETGQRHRGGFSLEIYQNTADGGVSSYNRNWFFYIRSGSALVWGNNLTRYDSALVMSAYRMWFPATPWGQANGANVWDVNDTADHTGNGFGGSTGGVFATGTHTGANGSSTLVRTGTAYATNQWARYSVRNLTRGTASEINSNTSNTITPYGNPQGAAMTFNTGDSFQIRRVNKILDGPGQGKGDLISGGSSTVNPTPATFPNNASNPIRIWGNTLQAGFGNGNGLPVVYDQAGLAIQNTDWFYSTDATAALPGYTPYTYPHPLVGGGAVVAAPQNLRVAP